MRRTFAPLLFLLASISALAVALVAQYGFGLEPCHLCTIQRIPYAFAILLALGALSDGGDANLRGLFLGLCALAFATDAGVAFFHIGVEHHWWEAACTGGENLATSAGGLLARLKQGKAAPACDSIPFALFGVSMAGLNLIVSLVLTFAAAITTRRAFMGR